MFSVITSASAVIRLKPTYFSAAAFTQLRTGEGSGTPSVSIAALRSALGNGVMGATTSCARVPWVFDFTLGTHPISRKGTTELGRSEATKRF